MPRRRKRSYTQTESLPSDLWEEEPFIEVYRNEPNRRPQYLGTHLAFGFSESHVQERYGGGQYLFCVIHGGRVLKRGCWDIWGPRIR